MPGRVGVHLMTLVTVQISSRPKQLSAESGCLLMSCSRVVDVQVEMHLLLYPVRPVGTYVVRCQLHADSPFTGSIDDAVPRFVFNDVAVEHRRPELALGFEIGCVEHHDAAYQVHDLMLRTRTAYGRPVLVAAWA